MAEWSEVLMSLTSNWNAGDSSGEGLSQFSSIIRFQTGHYNYYGSFVDSWLNGGQAWSSNNQKYVASPNAARSDWVTQTFTGVTTNAGDQIHGDGDQVSYGCALAFIFYLNTQLSFSIKQIIGAYTGTMASDLQHVDRRPRRSVPVLPGADRQRLSRLGHRRDSGSGHRQPLPDGAPVVLVQQQHFQPRPGQRHRRLEGRGGLQRLLPDPGRLQHQLVQRQRDHRADADAAASPACPASKFGPPRRPRADRFRLRPLRSSRIRATPTFPSASAFPSTSSSPTRAPSPRRQHHAGHRGA